jgi:murein DD-endopeptidase MepM/ murein hydrolase activator NlpD
MTGAFVSAGVVALVTGTVMPNQMGDPNDLALVDSNASADSGSVDRAKAVSDDRASRADARDLGASSAEVAPPSLYVLPLREYTITSKFGLRKLESEANAREHTGIDLAAPEGTTYYAVADGVVTRAGYNGGSGYEIEINHGGGIVSVYGHSKAQSLKVKVGDKVTAGQPIGEVGDTGYSFGPHLHFEIHVNGQREDPIPFLKGKGADVPGKTDPLTQD